MKLRTIVFVLVLAAVSALPPHRFAVGSAVNQTARQLGGALGIAVLVMLIGEPDGSVGAIERFHHLWAYSATAALVSGVIGSLIARPSATVSVGKPELFPELVAVDADLPLAVND